MVLYFITQSGRRQAPLAKFGVDLDEVKPSIKNFWISRIGTAIGALIMLAITDFALYLFARHQTIFFVNLDWTDPRPLFTPGAGRRLSLIVIAGFALSTMTLLIKLFTRSRWVDVVNSAISLGLIGLILTQPSTTSSRSGSPRTSCPRSGTRRNYALFIALMTTIELIKNTSSSAAGNSPGDTQLNSLNYGPQLA